MVIAHERTFLRVEALGRCHDPTSIRSVEKKMHDAISVQMKESKVSVR